MYISADRWRIILRDEYPNYIHAVFINVSTHDVMIFIDYCGYIYLD